VNNCYQITQFERRNGAQINCINSELRSQKVWKHVPVRRPVPLPVAHVFKVAADEASSLLLSCVTGQGEHNVCLSATTWRRAGDMKVKLHQF
jgi:hypothetical protein